MPATLPLELDVATLERVVLRPGPEFSEDDFFDFCQEHSLLRMERNSDGEIIVMAPAGLESGFLELEIAAQLRDWAKQHGHGIVPGPTSGVTLPDRSVLSPDTCWIPMERWKALSRKERRHFARVVPAFVIEVRSPSDRKRDLEENMWVYMRNQVELGWLIDPELRTVTIYSADKQTPTELVDPERVFGEGPVAGFALDLKQIYDQL